jgi:hypothetical protein
MKKLVAVLAIGLGLCLGGRASAQESIITYPVITPVAATSISTQPAKVAAAVSPACCKTKEAGCDTKCAACATCPKKPCHVCCWDKLKNWCGYRALPCGCCCYHCCECYSHVWAFFPPDRGCCGCGYGTNGGCATGGCATGACASGGCAGGSCQR